MSYIFILILVLKSRLQKEAGIEIPFIGSSFCVPEVFQNDIRDVLDSITLIYQSLRAQNTPKRADNWKTLLEEPLGRKCRLSIR